MENSEKTQLSNDEGQSKGTHCTTRALPVGLIWCYIPTGGIELIQITEEERLQVEKLIRYLFFFFFLCPGLQL